MTGSDATGPMTSRAPLSRTLPESEASQSVRVGTQIGRYHVLDRIGSGAMGEVFSAYDMRLDRRVAIKVLHARADPKAHMQLLGEAQALAKLDHPNVVKIFDIGPYEETVFIAMEFVRGLTFEQWADVERRSWRAVVATLLQAGRGLVAAHQAGLVHRDFKPTNVIVSPDGTARVLDFGLAASVEAARRTPSSEMLGTPAFMAPEQFDGTVDARSDQFAFCVVLYRALYGRRPFAGRSLSQLSAAVTMGKVEEPPARIQVPRRVRAAILRGLKPEPKDRFASMALLLAELEGALARRRRRLFGAAGVGVAAVGLALFVAPSASPSVCDGAAVRVAAVWNPERRAEVEGAFAIEDKSYVDATLRNVLAAVDAYGEAWADGYRDACEATRVRGQQSTAVMDRRMACLNRRLDGLGGLVDAFARADNAVVRKAVAATQRLRPVSECADEAFVMAQVEPPADTDTATAVAKVDRRLAEAFALRESGRLDEAWRLAPGLVDEAHALGHLPTLSSARRLDAGRFAAKGKFDLAEDALMAAFYEAQRSGAHVAAAEAATDLVFVLGTQAQRPRDALKWARHAEAALVRAAAGPMRRALLVEGEAGVRRLLGEYEASLRLHAQAHELLVRNGSGDSVMAGASALNVATVQLELGRYDESLAAYLDALEIFERAVGPEHPQVAQARENLGSLRFLRGENELAAEEYRRTLEIRERALPPDHPALARSHSNVGVAQARLGRLDVALTHQLESLAIFERGVGPDHPSVSGALNNLGAVYRSLGRLDEAERAFRRAIEVRRAAYGARHPRLVFPLRNLGAVAADRGQHREAVALYDEGLAIGVDTLEPTQVSLVLTHMSRGASLVALGRTREAIASLEGVLTAFTEQPTWEGHMAEAQLALATALLEAGRDSPRARALLATARAKLREFEARGVMGIRAAALLGASDRYVAK